MSHLKLQSRPPRLINAKTKPPKSGENAAMDARGSYCWACRHDVSRCSGTQEVQRVQPLHEALVVSTDSLDLTRRRCARDLSNGCPGGPFSPGLAGMRRNSFNHGLTSPPRACWT